MTVDNELRWLPKVTNELSAMGRPGQIALVEGPRREATALLAQLALLDGADVVSVSEAGLLGTPARSENELATRLETAWYLIDLESLCWSPWLRLDPIRFLRRLTRQHGVFAVWPGRLLDRTAIFSAPGRRDYVSVSIAGICVLRPVGTRFPDEIPFGIERIPT